MSDTEFTVQPQGPYLEITFTGQFSVPRAKQCVDDCIDACQTHRCSRVLFDCRRMTGELPMTERFMVILYAEKGREVFRKFAFLGSEAQVRGDFFVQNVARNRAINLNLFTDKDEAIAWLRDG